MHPHSELLIWILQPFGDEVCGSQWRRDKPNNEIRHSKVGNEVVKRRSKIFVGVQKNGEDNKEIASTSENG